MAQGLAGRHAVRRVPLETTLHEVEEQRVVAALQRRHQVLGRRRAAVLAPPGAAALQRDAAVPRRRRRTVARVALGADEVPRALRHVQQLLRRHPIDLYDTGQLVPFVLAWEQRVPGEQLGQNAAQAPHVDGHAVLGSEDHLGRAVEARLNVRVNALVLVAARAEVNDLYTTAALLLQQDILRLQVTVDDAVLVESVQALQNGVRELAHELQAEALELVLLDQLVQVHAEQLERDANVVPAIRMKTQFSHCVSFPEERNTLERFCPCTKRCEPRAICRISNRTYSTAHFAT